MNIRHFFLFLIWAVPVTACTTNNITSVEEVYATRLDVPRGSFDLSIGYQGFGLGVSAVIFGKDHAELGDSMIVIVRDPSILQVITTQRSQWLAPDGNGNMSVYMLRVLDFQGLKPGTTQVVVKAGKLADSLQFVVNQPKG